MGTELLFDKRTATLTARTSNSDGNRADYSLRTDPELIPGVKQGNVIILGSAHTHQVADFTAPDPNDERRTAEYQNNYGDGTSAASSGQRIYSIDSYHVDRHSAASDMMRPGQKISIPTNNIFTTQSLFNNQNSILRDALRDAAKIC
jgi:hypothetical protein